MVPGPLDCGKGWPEAMGGKIVTQSIVQKSLPQGDYDTNDLVSQTTLLGTLAHHSLVRSHFLPLFGCVWMINVEP